MLTEEGVEKPEIKEEPDSESSEEEEVEEVKSKKVGGVWSNPEENSEVVWAKVDDLDLDESSKPPVF